MPPPLPKTVCGLGGAGGELYSDGGETVTVESMPVKDRLGHVTQMGVTVHIYGITR